MGSFCCRVKLQKLDEQFPLSVLQFQSQEAPPGCISWKTHVFSDSCFMKTVFKSLKFSEFSHRMVGGVSYEFFVGQIPQLAGGLIDSPSRIDTKKPRMLGGANANLSVESKLKEVLGWGSQLRY